MIQSYKKKLIKKKEAGITTRTIGIYDLSSLLAGGQNHPLA